MPERARAAATKRSPAGVSRPGPSGPGASGPGPSGTVQWIGRNWSLLFLVLELAFFGVFGLHFFSAENLQNILVASTTVLLLGVGETFVIISGGIDLSVGTLAACSGVVAAVALRDHGLAAGIAAGAATGVILILAVVIDQLSPEREAVRA